MSATQRLRRHADEPDRVRIDDHVWTQQQIAWLKIDDGLPHFSQSSPAVPTKV